MTQIFPHAPPTGTAMSPSRPSAEARRLLALRRSAGKETLGPPGPSPEALDELLRVAARVPDHRRLEPWRFIVFEGDQRAAFGARLADILARRDPDATDKTLASARALPLRAPSVVTVVSSPDPTHKTPVWEQELSAGAVCQNLLVAANAAGWGAVWLTEWIAYDDDVACELGLSRRERVAGFIYIGTATAKSPERPRPDVPAKTERWCAQGTLL